MKYNYQNNYNWHPLYNYVMIVKREYMKGNADSENYNFNDWLDYIHSVYADENCEIKDKIIRSVLEVFKALDVTCYSHYALFKYKGYIELGDLGFGSNFFELYNGLYRECRSIVFDLKNDTIELASLSKFKNYNEDEDSWKADNIWKKYDNASGNFYITNKMDGSYQQYRYDVKEDEIIGSGSSALDRNESWRLAEGYSLLTDGHKRMFKDFPDWTFIFEYISPKNPIVVKYTKEQEGLYLLAARNVNDGSEMTFSELKGKASWYSIKITENYADSLSEVLSQTGKYTSDEKEGWVLDIIGVDGVHFRVKIKTEDYVLMHKVLSQNISPNAVIEAIQNNRYDDFVSKVPLAYKDIIENYKNNVMTYLKEFNFAVNYFYNKGKIECKNYLTDKKEAMIWIDNNVPQFLRARVVNVYLGRENDFLVRKGFCYHYSDIEKTLEKLKRINVVGE